VHICPILLAIGLCVLLSTATRRMISTFRKKRVRHHCADSSGTKGARGSLAACRSVDELNAGDSGKRGRGLVQRCRRGCGTTRFVATAFQTESLTGANTRNLIKGGSTNTSIRKSNFIDHSCSRPLPDGNSSTPPPQHALAVNPGETQYRLNEISIRNEFRYGKAARNHADVVRQHG